MNSGKELAKYCVGKIGTPYFYGAKMNVLTEAMMNSLHKSYPSKVTISYMNKARKKGQVGKINTDCSGIIGAYRNKHLGSSQLYSTASKRIPIKDIKSMPIGTVLWKSGHVGVLVSNGTIPMCVEAKGIDYGVIESKVSSTNWKYGLLFSDMTYEYTGVKNPYPMPTKNIKRGAKGDEVAWIQYELIESGYNITIDKSFGTLTEKAVKNFQMSCKIACDGIVGPQTRKELLCK